MFWLKIGSISKVRLRLLLREGKQMTIGVSNHKSEGAPGSCLKRRDHIHPIFDSFPQGIYIWYGKGNLVGGARLFPNGKKDGALTLVGLPTGGRVKGIGFKPQHLFIELL